MYSKIVNADVMLSQYQAERVIYPQQI